MQRASERNYVLEEYPYTWTFPPPDSIEVASLIAQMAYFIQRYVLPDEPQSQGET
jgi:hypothetical protein